MLFVFAIIICRTFVVIPSDVRPPFRRWRVCCCLLIFCISVGVFPFSYTYAFFFAYFSFFPLPSSVRNTSKQYYRNAADSPAVPFPTLRAVKNRPSSAEMVHRQPSREPRHGRVSMAYHVPSSSWSSSWPFEAQRWKQLQRRSPGKTITKNNEIGQRILGKIKMTVVIFVTK